MAKPYSRVTVKGVGTSKQIRRTIRETIPGLKADLKLTGIPVSSEIMAQIKKGINNANEIIASRLGDALDAALTSTVWEWRDGGTRDIIDTGKLLASRDIQVIGDRIQISYNVPYAGIVHFGGYVLPYGNPNAQKVYVPARPWVDSVILGNGPVPAFDFESIYKEAIAKAI